MKKLSTFFFILISFTLGFGSFAAADTLEETRRLAEQGEPQAQIDLGSMYQMGIGVTQDYAEAVKWFKLAAEQGDTNAQYFVGLAYYKGEGVGQDYGEAARWLQMAAEVGDVAAQSGLALLYRYGDGVAQDLVQAYKWYSLSANGGDPHAPEYRDEVAGEMSSDQIEEGNRLVEEWTPQQ